MFPQNLRYLRNKFDMDQQELADKLGRKSTSTISEWEKGKYTPKAGTLNDIAHIFNVKIDDLMGTNLREIDLNNSNTIRNDITTIYNQLNSKHQQAVYKFAQSQLDEQIDEQNKKSCNVLHLHEPAREVVLAGVVSAGTGEFQTDDLESETVMYYGTIPPHDYALRVNGDSMAPMLEDQQIIFVNKSNGASVRTGQIIIAILNGCSYVKKIDLANNSIRLVSLNSKYKPINITSNDNFKIQGIVSL